MGKRSYYNMKAHTAVILLLLSSFDKTQTQRKWRKAVRNNNLKAINPRLRVRNSRELPTS